MAGRAIPREVLQSYVDAVAKYGGQNAAARALNINRNTFVCQLAEARRLKLVPAYTPPPIPLPSQIPPRIQYVSERTKPQGEPVRHYMVPDTQVRPGVPTDHIDWIADDIVERKPDVIIVIGDWWDFPSLNRHAEPGSAPLENVRFKDDVDSGNEAFMRLCQPIEAEMERTKKHKSPWKPRCVFTEGNHEDRADRAAQSDPKWLGTIGSNHCQVRGFEWHAYGKIVEIDGIMYSHLFTNPNSGKAIGGTPQNRLNKVSQSFTQGHLQGFEYGTKITPGGRTMHGLVAGSAYVHREDYRGVHQSHFRGVCVKNEVRDGDYCIMPLTLNYLSRKYTGMSLYDYHTKKFPDGEWEHLR